MTEYIMKDPDGDTGRADAIAHLSAILGLAGNRDAIGVSMTRLRNAARDYSDYELRRFAQLVILSEHPPGEWRENLLAGVLN